MKTPDFLVVGAARAGTTALHHYLNQHPALFLPKQKEPCFYCFTGKKINYKKGKFAFAVTDKKKYVELFRKSRPGQVTGEISTPYLYLHKQTISNIRKYHSNAVDVKIVIILRDPVERAYSQYLWKVRDGREEYSFETALKKESSRMSENYSFDYFYSHRGLYYEQVKDYIENFKNVKIILFDEFKDSFTETMKGLCEFLGVDGTHEFVRKKNLNSSNLPRWTALGKLMTVESKLKFKLLNYVPVDLKLTIKENLNKWNSSLRLPKPIRPETRKYLEEYYRNDILKLQQLTGLDLSYWLHS